MKKINIRRLYYHASHNYFTLNNVVIAVAFFIAAGWAWGSLSVMQRNYDLQKDLDFKKRQLQLAELQTSSLELQGRYYKTQEFQELAVRQDLGLGLPGESVLILPPNTQTTKDLDTVAVSQSAQVPQKASNMGQWMNFLFGSNSKNTSK